MENSDFNIETTNKPEGDKELHKQIVQYQFWQLLVSKYGQLNLKKREKFETHFSKGKDKYWNKTLNVH